MKWPVTPVPADVTALRPLGVTMAACLLAANSSAGVVGHEAGDSLDSGTQRKLVTTSNVRDAAPSGMPTKIR